MLTGRKIKIYLALYLCYIIYSLGLVSSKFAGGYPLLSIQALGLYGLAFFILGVFALVWQQILKYLPLTIAHANRAVVIPLGMLWGVLLFDEIVTWNMLFGIMIIVCGVVCMVYKHE